MPRIDPKDFSQSQWEELFNASELLEVEIHHQAEPFDATPEEIAEAVACCRSKAERVADGELGDTDEDEGVDIDDWAQDLNEAADTLEAYLTQEVQRG